jgi:protease I
MSEHESKISRRRVMAASLGMAAAAAAGAVEAAPRPKGGSLKGKKVLVAIGDFSEGMETYYMVYRLIEEGVTPVVAAPKVKLLQMVVHDFDPQYSNYIERPGYLIKTEIAYKDVKPGDYAGLLIPGDRGPEEMRQNQDALAVVGYFLDKNLPLGAMCHGPQMVYAARPIKGRKITAYAAIRPDVELAGGIYVDAPAVVDGALVTSRGWPDLPYFMPKFLQVLKAHV